MWKFVAVTNLLSFVAGVTLGKIGFILILVVGSGLWFFKDWVQSKFTFNSGNNL